MCSSGKKGINQAVRGGAPNTGVSKAMEKKNWVDSSGRKGKGYGVFRYEKKYGANVDGYCTFCAARSPIHPTQRTASRACARARARVAADGMRTTPPAHLDRFIPPRLAAPIYTPNDWSSKGDTYAGGEAGLKVWAAGLTGLLLTGAFAIYATSAIGQ